MRIVMVETIGALATSAVIIIACSLIIDSCSQAHIAVSEHVYDINYGSVVCGRAESTDCGVTLTNCHDGAEYKCMQNVRRRSE